MTQPFVAAQGISKQFAGVQALRDVSMAMGPGEIRFLVGENGCGKSTLIKILAGVYRPDCGTITINNQAFHQLRPIDAISRGIQVIYQDFSLFPNLSVAENIALPILLKQRRHWVRWQRTRQIAEQALGQIAPEINLSQCVQDLSVACRQLVAIARALAHDARLVIMDEATSALTHREIDRLFGIIQGLQQRNVSVLFVSHKLNEVFEISDQVTVLRNGRNIAQGSTAKFQRRQLMELITGHDWTPRRLSENPVVGPRASGFVTGKDPGAPGLEPDRILQQAPRRPEERPVSTVTEAPLLRVEGLSRRALLTDISFSVHAGEIVGITGLLGSGRQELGLSLFGILPARSGTIKIAGKTVSIRNVQDAMRHGIAFVPEDRLTEGLFMERSVRKNILATTAQQLLTPWHLLDRVKVKNLCRQCVRRWDIRTAGTDMAVQTLSGGNQQKVVLAKWLSTNAKLLILNGPTAGVDIGAKAEIHAQMKQLAGQGMALLVMSDDLPELVQTCHRILLMHRGRIVEQLECTDCTEDRIQRKLNDLT